jgi:hypothetical protein
MACTCSYPTLFCTSTSNCYYYYYYYHYHYLTAIGLTLGGSSIHLHTFTVDAGLLASSQYPEGPATGHLGTGFSWFPCV